jgi:hypothetical protein
MYRTKDQNIKLHALIGKLQIDAETKAEMVFKCTGGRSKSSADMLIHECTDLIGKLQLMADGKSPQKQFNAAEDKMRKKILSICYEMQWTLAGKLDWNRINFWLKKFGYLHKEELNDYKEAELPKLVTQFENLLKSYYAKG